MGSVLSRSRHQLPRNVRKPAAGQPPSLPPGQPPSLTARQRPEPRCRQSSRPGPGSPSKSGSPDTDMSASSTDSASRPAFREVDPLLFQRLADHPVGHPGRIPLARQQTGQAAHPQGERPTSSGSQLRFDQAPGGSHFLLRAEIRDGGPHVALVYPALAQLGGQSPAGKTPATVPSVHPCSGERRVIYQARPGEPVKGRVSRLLRYSPSPQRLIELRPRSRRRGEQPQAHLQGRRLRVFALPVTMIGCCLVTRSATCHRPAARHRRRSRCWAHRLPHQAAAPRLAFP